MAGTDTKRKPIAEQMVTVFGQVPSVATAWRWRDPETDPFTPDELPAVNVKDGRAIITHGISLESHELEVLLELYTLSTVSIDDIESIVADLTAAITTNDTWGGHADGTTIDSHDLNVQQYGDTINSATLGVSAKYTTERGEL